MTARRAGRDPYDDLPVALRRANLRTHREALLSDRMAAELHNERLELHNASDDDVAAARARLARIDEALSTVEVRLEALPADDDEG